MEEARSEEALREASEEVDKKKVEGPVFDLNMMRRNCPETEEALQGSSVTHAISCP